MHFSNNNQYSGHWNCDKMHGYGEYWWAAGRLYLGFWEKDSKEGFGIHYWSNPERAYVGFLKNNKQDGVGCVITNKILKYGIWEKGDKKEWLSSYYKAYKMFPENKEINYETVFPKDLEEAKEILKRIR
jgi:hypothetical protein